MPEQSRAHLTFEESVILRRLLVDHAGATSRHIHPAFGCHHGQLRLHCLRRATPGEPRRNCQPLPPHGEPQDERPKFYYLRARFYDPATDCFTQPNPLGHAEGDNLYKM